MATDTVMNRTDFPINIIYNVNGADFPVAQWIINPDLSILDTVPIKYCKIVGDALVEMTAAEKAAVDAADLAAAKASAITAVTDARERYIEYGTGPEYPAGSGNHLPTTDEDMGRWLYWQSIGGKWASLGLNYPFVVYSRDGSTSVTITKSQDFTAVVEVIGVYVVGLFNAAQAVITAVHAATTVAGVTAASSSYIASAPAVPTA